MTIATERQADVAMPYLVGDPQNPVPILYELHEPPRDFLLFRVAGMITRRRKLSSRGHPRGVGPRGLPNSRKPSKSVTVLHS